METPSTDRAEDSTPRSTRRVSRWAAAILIAWCCGPAFAGSVSLTSGTPGALTGVPQSFNETRGIDVTVLSSTEVSVVAMTLNGFLIGSASSAQVGARVYSSTGSLLASSTATVSSGGSVTVPIASILAPGATYRVAFHLATTPANQGSGFLFDPDPAGSGGFPYVESSGQLRINSAHAISTDSYPTNPNIFVPQIVLDVAPPAIDVITGTTGTMHTSQSFNETRGVDVTVLASSTLSLNALRLNGLSIGGASSALVGARIYASPAGTLLASAQTTVSTGGSITVPMAFELLAGASYRVSFYVETMPPNQGSGTFLDPAPSGTGGFPYVEATGQVRINSARSVGADAYPTNANIFVPQIVLFTSAGSVVPFCFGDGTAAQCPCSNNGTLGHGCDNSSATGGSLLTASGFASTTADSLKLSAVGEKPTALSIFLQGSTGISAVTYGDGLRCVGGILKRLHVESAVNGTVLYPDGAEPSITARSAALGDPISSGVTRNYQVYYRDPSSTFCPTPPGSTFNVSNAVGISWR